MVTVNYLYAASALYALPSNRVTVWMPGLSYAPTSGSYAPQTAPTGWTGGIPTNYTKYGSTLTPSGGDDTSQINTALAAAGAAASASNPKYVQLSAGNFNLHAASGGLQINDSYVQLIGVGPGAGMTGALSSLPSFASATGLVVTSGSSNDISLLTIGNPSGQSGAGVLDPSNGTIASTVLTTADCVAGTNSCTLVSGLSLTAGEMVYVSEEFDPNRAWMNTGSGAQWSGFLGFGINGNSSTLAACRPIGQALEVSSYNSGTKVVTFTTPFAYTYRAAFSAAITTVNGSQVKWSGVTGCFMYGASAGNGGGMVQIGQCMYCWVNSCETAGHIGEYNGPCVQIENSFRCEVRDSYIHSIAADITEISPGGTFYNLILDSLTSDSLVENNISWIGNKVMVMRSAGSGNVIGYNYMDDGYGYGYVNLMETGLNQDHMSGTHHTLFEGNYSWQMGTDSRWGNQTSATWFRNWATGMRCSAWPATFVTPYGSSTATGNPLIGLNPGGSSGYYEDGYNRNPAKIGSYHWNYNFVGNVLGYPGNPLLTSPKSDAGAFPVVQTGTAYEQYGPNTPSVIDDTIIPMWTMGVTDSEETSANTTYHGYISGTTLFVTTGPAIGGGGSDVPLLEYGLGVTGSGVTSGTYIVGPNPSSNFSATGAQYTVTPSQTVGSSGSPVAFTSIYYGNGLNQTVLPTTLRDANFDYYTGAVHWHGIGGSGTGQTTPPGASATGGSVLPASLYQTSKPAFFGAATWPWVDGSNASNPLPGALPALTRFQAGTPNV